MPEVDFFVAGSNLIKN